MIKKITAIKQSNFMTRFYNSISHILYFVAILPILLLTLSCAGPGAEVKRRYFWPPLPDTPRIEFIASYRSNLDFPRSGMQSMLDSITGIDERGFEKPWGITTDINGKVYVVDTFNGQIVIFDLINQKVEILGKGEFAGLFQAPIGITIDGNGNIYVSDTKKQRVFTFTKDEKALATIGSDETLDWPTGMSVNDKVGRLYVVNSHKHNIAVFDLSGKHLFDIGKRGEKDGYFNYPTDVSLDSQGNLVVADSMNARVQVFDPDGKFLRKFGKMGDGITDFQVIKGIAVDKASDNVYVVDARAHRFLIFDKEGTPLLTIGGAASAITEGKLFPGGFLLPQGISIDKTGRIYIVDALNKRFQVFQIVTEDWLKKNPVK